MRNCYLVVTLMVFSTAPPVKADNASKAKEDTVQVPYRLTDTQHVLIRAKINGKGPFNFIVDTGAPALFVATDVAKQVNVTPDKTGWGTFDRFEIEGGVVIPKAKGRIETPFQLEGMNGMGLAGVQLHGIIGYNLLARYRLEFDFTRDKMAWTRLDYDPPLPVGLAGAGGGTGLDALGSIMKLMGAFLGKKASPEMKLRGYLGVELSDDKDGVKVTKVLPTSPADNAGVKPEDRITRFQGKTITSLANLQRLASQAPSGQSIRLSLNRNGETKEVTLTLGEGL
jgi:hypothetical protein